MSDRAYLFIGSILLVVLSLSAAGWLVVSHQAFSLDGLFMVLVCLLVALCFALYAWNLVAMAKEEIVKESAPKAPAKKATASQEA
jgi:hypothetical protein